MNSYLLYLAVGTATGNFFLMLMMLIKQGYKTKWRRLKNQKIKMEIEELNVLRLSPIQKRSVATPVFKPVHKSTPAAKNLPGDPRLVSYINEMNASIREIEKKLAKLSREKRSIKKSSRCRKSLKTIIK